MVRGSAWMLLVEVVILPTAFVTSVYLARRLGPANFGLFAIATRLVLWIEIAVLSMFSGATIRFASASEDWRPVAATSSRLHLISGLLLAILVWSSSGGLSRLFNEPSLSFYISLIAIEIPVLALAWSNITVLNGRGKFKIAARLRFVYWVSRLALIVALVESGLSITGAVIGSVGAAWVQLIASCLYTRTHLLDKHAFSAGEFFRFGLPLSISNMSQRLFRIDLFALKIFGGSAFHAGHYAAAINLSMPTTLALSKSVTPPLLSTISRLRSQGRHKEALKTARIALRSVFWVLPLTCLVSTSSREIVTLVYGNDFAGAATALSLLIFAATGLYIINIGRAILTAYDKPARTLALTLPMVPLALIGHLLVTPAFQMTGAASVTCAISLLGAFTSLVMVYRMWKVPPPLATLAKSLVCCSAAITISRFWEASGFLVLFKLVAVGLAVMIFFFLLREFSGEELTFARSVFERRRTASTSSEDR